MPAIVLAAHRHRLSARRGRLSRRHRLRRSRDGRHRRALPHRRGHGARRRRRATISSSSATPSRSSAARTPRCSTPRRSGALPRRDFEQWRRAASTRWRRQAAASACADGEPASGARRRAAGPRHGHARGDARDAARAGPAPAAQRQVVAVFPRLSPSPTGSRWSRRCSARPSTCGGAWRRSGSRRTWSVVGVEPTEAEIARRRGAKRAGRTPPCSSSTTRISTGRTARCWSAAGARRPPSRWS